jgi:hypothetical protein
MNVQIYRNTKNQEGDVNYTNKFTMTLPEPIDGENKTRYIRALNVTYPLMINNIEEKTCGIRFKHCLFWNSQLLALDNITIETEWVYLTRGRYTLKKLIRKLNAISQEYGFHFSILPGGHVGISVNMEPKYVYRYNDSDRLTHVSHTVKSTSDFSFEMSKDLKYILGMDEIVLHPEVQAIFDDGSVVWNYAVPPTPMEYILTTIVIANVKGEDVNKLWYFFMVNIAQI